MRARIAGSIGLVAGLVLLGSEVASAQPPPTKPLLKYGNDFRVRKGGSPDFGKDTPKIAVEVFKDEAAGALVAITQAGNLTVSPAGADATDTKPTWLFAHDLRVRRSDEQRFTADTTKFGVEVFRDPGAGRLFYVCEKGTAAFADAVASSTDKGPAWHHGLLVKVRGANEDSFATAKKFGIEAFHDENTGGLLYVTETGAISAAPAPTPPSSGDMVKAPTALYGLTLRVRKAAEPEFGANTRKYGVEVFRDENTGGLLYVSEIGSIATAPAPANLKPGKDPVWTHAMNLRARPGGEADFSKATRYGIEVYRDNNTRHLIFICETGAIAVLPGK